MGFLIFKQANHKADADSSVTEGRGRCSSNAAQGSSCLTACQQLETDSEVAATSTALKGMAFSSLHLPLRPLGSPVPINPVRQQFKASIFWSCLLHKSQSSTIFMHSPCCFSVYYCLSSVSPCRFVYFHITTFFKFCVMFFISSPSQEIRKNTLVV